MVLGRNVIAAPSLVTVRFDFNPVFVLSNGMILAHHEQSWLDGVDPTLRNFYLSLSDEQKHIHQLVYGTFVEAIPNVGSMPFPEFLSDFATRDPVQLRDAVMSSLHNKEGFPGIEALLASEQTLVNYMVKLVQEKGDYHTPEVEDEMHQAYPYLIDPPRLKATMLEYMTFVWGAILQKEWRKHEASVQHCVEAHQQRNYPPFNSIYEAVEVITGRDMRQGNNLKHISDDQKRFVFLPSPYLGPYISSQHEPGPYDNELMILFGVRQPQGVKKSILATNRSELLVWMNALADDTRLQMLEMLLEEGEICAQDFIDRLQLSQSSASRHLRQLVTAGFITSRRQDVAKCYTLNQDRLGELVETLQHFTAKKPS
jgi:DNA-binding transcriptional ArsR family regulator